MMATPTVEGAAVAALRAVLHRAQQATERFVCRADEARVVVVSKTKHVSLISQVYDAGHRCFGKNYVQDIMDEAPQNGKEGTNNEREINNKKRKKSTHDDFQMTTRRKYSELELGEENIALSLSTRPLCPELQPPPPLSQQPAPLFQPPPQAPLQLSPAHAVCIPPPSPSPPMSNNSSSSAPQAAHSHETPPPQQLHPPSIPAPLLQPPPQVPLPSAEPGSTHRRETGPSQAPREGKGDTVPAPFPWATTRRATVHSLKDLQEMRITAVSGEVQCKRCERRYEMEYDLHEKFREVGTFVAGNKIAMRDRAPPVWMNPVLPSCKLCHQENCVKPVVSEKKKAINWLFLLLGQLLGCCTLEQLKYFCKHTKKHRTGAKDRVLFLTYLGLCKQLDPQGPFDR